MLISCVIKYLHVHLAQLRSNRSPTRRDDKDINMEMTCRKKHKDIGDITMILKVEIQLMMNNLGFLDTGDDISFCFSRSFQPTPPKPDATL